MSMKANLERDAIGNIIVQMNGDLNYENARPFEKELREILEENPTADITLNMQNIDFVGSSGIGQFVNTLKRVNEEKTKVRLSNVRAEFLKVFKLYDLSDADLSVIIDDFENDDTEGLSFRYGRKLTFQN